MSERAPVQRESCHFPARRCKLHPVDDPRHIAGTVAWSEHLEAWADYARQYGSGQSAERLAERGGFGYSELVEHLGHEPTTWEPR